MHPPLSPAVWCLPEEAVPFVRELVLEISRRLPEGLGSGSRFEPAELRDAADCMAACRALLAWLETAPKAFGDTVAQWEDAFVSVLGASREVDNKLHRAVLEARAWVGEELAFSHAMREVLEDIEVHAPSCSPAGVNPLVRIVRQIEAKEHRGQDEALALSGHFDRVQEDLHQVRDRVAGVESQLRRLLDQGLRDPITGLWNGKACEDRVGEEVSRALRYGAPLSLVLWDVDRLKDINDTHGHRAGDAVLRELAGRVLRLLRQSDYVARQGSRFLALLPNATLSQAANVGSKILTLAESAPIPISTGALTVTVSVGVASLAPCGDAGSLLADAERALARAKAGGRNRMATEGS